MHTCQEILVGQTAGEREVEMGLEATLAVGSQASLQCSGLLETARDAKSEQDQVVEEKHSTFTI